MHHSEAGQSSLQSEHALRGQLLSTLCQLNGTSLEDKAARLNAQGRFSSPYPLGTGSAMPCDATNILVHTYFNVVRSIDMRSNNSLVRGATSGTAAKPALTV